MSRILTLIVPPLLPICGQEQNKPTVYRAASLVKEKNRQLADGHYTAFWLEGAQLPECLIKKTKELEAMDNERRTTWTLHLQMEMGVVMKDD